VTKSKQRQNVSAELARAIAAGDFRGARRILGSAGANGKPDPPPVAPARAAGPMSLAEACGGCDAVALVNGRQVHYHTVRRTLDRWLPVNGPGIEREVVSVLRGARRQMDELAASPALCHAANARPEDMLFVSPWPRGPEDPALLLVGVLFCEDKRLIVEHYIAGDERAEAGLCQAFAQRHARAAVLATFRAKRSHRKHLADRCELHGVDLSAEAWDAPTSRVRAGLPPHLDLRKECRARWHGRVPSCSLPALERTVLARSRPKLIPRAAVPEACRVFASSGDATAMGDVLAHCAADLATMAQLGCMLLTGCETDAMQ